MRSGYTEALRKRLERHPANARPILEVLTVESEDIRDTYADWEGADIASGGYDSLEEGGAVLTPSAAVLTQNTTILTGADITSLPPFPGSAHSTATIEWTDADIEHAEIRTVSARLNPDSGGGKEVTYWVMRLFRVSRITATGFAGQQQWTFQLLAPESRQAAGPSEGDVTFTFGDDDWAPTPGAAPEVTPEAVEAGAPTVPITVIVVSALKGEGVEASNVEWVCDSGNASLVNNRQLITRREFSATDTAQAAAGGTVYDMDSTPVGLPVITVSGSTYSGTTITFSSAGSGDYIDLGASPGASTDLQIVVEGHEPSDSSLTVQIDDGVQGWTTVYDGDVIGEDNSGDPEADPFDPYANLGADLSSFLRQQTYDIRVTLTPNTATTVTPIIRRMGVSEIDHEAVDGLVRFGETSWAVDPLTMQSEVPSIEVELLRNGVRDYRSFVEDLFSSYNIGQLYLRVYIGHPDLPRQSWLKVDDFVIDDYETSGPAVRLYCVSPLAFTLRDIPPTSASTPLTYASAGLKTVYDDLLNGQMGVQARLRGPGVEDDSTTVSKVIRTPRKGLDELRRICDLAGGAIISSQGRLKFVNFFDARAPRQDFGHNFAEEEIKVLGLSPGFRTRITGFRVFYGWNSDLDNGRGAYAGSRYHDHDDAITNLGRALVDIEESLEDETCQWIPGTTLANTIASRKVTYFSTGMIMLRFRSNIPHPELEPGDAIAVEQERFVARDPNTGRAIRGPMWMLGRISAVHDVLGTEFTAWIRTYADILPGATGATITDYAYPEIVSCEVRFPEDGNNYAIARFQTRQPDTGSVKAAASTSTYPTAATVRLESEVATDSDGFAEVTFTGPYTVGQSVFISAFAYETAAAGGTEGSELFQQLYVRPALHNAVQVQVQLEPYNTSGFSYVRPVISVTPASDVVQSVHHITYWDIGGGDVVLLQGNEDVPSPPDPFTFNGGAMDVSQQPTSVSVVVTPYDDTGGSGGAGTAGPDVRVWFPALDNSSATGFRGADGESGSIYSGDRAIVADGLELTSDSNERPNFRLKYTLSTSAPTGTPEDGELWFRYS